MLYVLVTEETHLLDGSQTYSLRSPKVDGQRAGSIFSSSSACQHSAEQWSPYCPSTSALRITMFLHLILLGKVGEAKSWQLPTRKPPVCRGGTEQVSHVQKQILPPPPQGWKTHTSPLLYPWEHLPQPTAPTEPVLSGLCGGTFHTTTGAFRSQRATEDQACHIFVFHTA